MWGISILADFRPMGYKLSWCSIVWSREEPFIQICCTRTLCLVFVQLRFHEIFMIFWINMHTTNFYKKGRSTYLMKAHELNWKSGLQKWFQLTVMYLQFIIPRDILSVLCLHCQPIRVTYFSIEVFTSKFRISRHLSRFFSPSGTLYIGK